MVINKKRRIFLFTTTAASTAIVGAYLARPYLSALLRPGLDENTPPGFLIKDEMRTIIALVEILVAQDSLPSESFFQDYVNEITANQKGYLKEYQNAAKLLNRTSTDLFKYEQTLGFDKLSIEARNKVLGHLLWQYDADDRVVRKLEKIEASKKALALRVFVMEPLIEHYYRSTFGWAVVGYTSFPGNPPHDPRAYTMPLGQEKL